MIYITSLSDITTASHQHYAYYEPINLILSITLYARIVKDRDILSPPRRIWWWNVSKIHASWFTVSIAINTNWSIEMFIQVSLIGSRLRRHGSSGSEAHWKTLSDLIWFDSGIRWTLAPQPSHPKNKEKRGTKETKIEIEKSKVHQTNSRAVSLQNQSDSGAYHRLWGSVKSGARFFPSWTPTLRRGKTKRPTLEERGWVGSEASSSARVTVAQPSAHAPWLRIWGG